MSLAKKIFIISTTLLSVVLFFWGVYAFVFKKDTVSLSSQKNIITKEGAIAPKVDSSALNKTEKISAMTNEAVISPTFDRGKNMVVYHLSQSGKVMNKSINGQEERIASSAEIPGLSEARWSPGGNKAILKINDSNGAYFDVYDYAANTDKEFKGGVDTLVWTNMGDKVLYKYFDANSGKRTLNIANPDGTDWKVLAEVKDRALDIAQVPQTTTVSFWNSPNAFEETALRTVSLLGGEIKTIFTGRFGADYLWSPNGEKVLISSSESKGSGKINLGIANASGGEYNSLDIPTLVSKCVWAKNSKLVYYALPNSIPEGEVMPNSYLDKKITTQDTFWKLDITTGKKERIVGLDEIKKSYDADQLFLSPDEKTLFFVNRADGNKLYEINLSN
jgi:hypothetical protein